MYKFEEYSVHHPQPSRLLEHYKSVVFNPNVAHNLFCDDLGHKSNNVKSSCHHPCSTPQTKILVLCQLYWTSCVTLHSLCCLYPVIFLASYPTFPFYCHYHSTPIWIHTYISIAHNHTLNFFMASSNDLGSLISIFSLNVTDNPMMNLWILGFSFLR